VSKPDVISGNYRNFAKFMSECVDAGLYLGVFFKYWVEHRLCWGSSWFYSVHTRKFWNTPLLCPPFHHESHFSN